MQFPLSKYIDDIFSRDGTGQSHSLLFHDLNGFGEGFQNGFGDEFPADHDIVFHVFWDELLKSNLIGFFDEYKDTTMSEGLIEF